MTRPRVGLLPLYLALYDECLPELRAEVTAFAGQIADRLRGAGLDVVEGPVCCVAPEIRAAVRAVEVLGVDLLVTLHLSYSPSLEAVEALVQTQLPILMLDTTPAADFGRHVDPSLLLANHGIHGVQDLASMLRRKGRRYSVVAGHPDCDSVIDRAASHARGAAAAGALRRARILRLGEPFVGMGDFSVEPEVLASVLGLEVASEPIDALADSVAAITEAEVEAEMAEDAIRYDVVAPREVHSRSARLGLGLRRYMARNGFDGLTMNFQSFDRPDGPLSTVPFLECCKAMASGFGYAGEGDTLTAALVRALAVGWGDVTFTEMFCADWSGGSIFLSHMGEVNPAVAARRPRLYEKPYPFSAAQNPATLACAIQPGPATLVNVSPGPGDSFRLICAPLTVLDDGTHPEVDGWIRAWVQPAIPVATFLEGYSCLGGTHHCGLVLGAHLEGLRAFADLAGMEFRVVGEP